MLSTRLLASFCSLAVCSFSACCPKLDPKAPQAIQVEPLPAVEESTVYVTLGVELPAFQPEIDKLIPDVTDAGWHQNQKTHRLGSEGFCATWYFDRRPSQLTATPDDLNLVIPGGFGLIGDPWLDFLGIGCTQPFFSCGDKSAGIAPVPLDFRFGVPLGLSPDYKLAGFLTNRGTLFHQDCRLLFGLVDITDKLRPILDNLVNQAIASFRPMFDAATDFRPQASKVWSALNQPRDLGDGYWLVMRPTKAHGKIAGDSQHSILATVGLAGQLEITTSKPPDTPQPNLPPLETAPAGNPGVNLVVAASVPYDRLASKLAKELRGQTLTFEFPPGTARKIKIEDLHLSAPVACSDPRGCMSVATTLSGDACGIVYIVGRPEIDNVRREVVFHDLSFSVESKNVITEVADWLLHGTLQQKLVEAAHFPIGSELDNAATLATDAINATLSDGLVMTGKVDPTKIYVSLGQAGLDLRVSLTGNVDLRFTPQAPKPSSPRAP